MVPPPRDASCHGRSGRVVWKFDSGEQWPQPLDAVLHSLDCTRLHRDVSNLSSRTRLFSVKMKMRSRLRQDPSRVRQIADDVQHGAGFARGGRPQGKAKNRSQMVLELAGFRSLNGPM